MTYMLSVATVTKFDTCPVSLSTTVMWYDVIAPFCNSKSGACQDILTLVELTEAAITLLGDPVGATMQ